MVISSIWGFRRVRLFPRYGDGGCVPVRDYCLPNSHCSPNSPHALHVLRQPLFTAWAFSRPSLASLFTTCRRQHVNFSLYFTISGFFPSFWGFLKRTQVSTFRCFFSPDKFRSVISMAGWPWLSWKLQAIYEFSMPGMSCASAWRQLVQFHVTWSEWNWRQAHDCFILCVDPDG